MKALVLAGGRGTRLGALTADRPKPMVMIAGAPMIERIMRGISETAGIVEFVLVTGYLGDVVRHHFGDGAAFGWRVDYVGQDAPRGVGHAVDMAASVLSEAPFMMTYGDIMLDPVNYGRAVDAHRDHTADAIVGLNWVEDPWAGAAVYVDDAHRLMRIEEKPPRGTATTNWNNAGLFVLPPAVFEYTSKLSPSPRGEFELPDALSAMIADGLRLQGIPLTGAWRDVGTPADYEAINLEFGARPPS